MPLQFTSTTDSPVPGSKTTARLTNLKKANLARQRRFDNSRIGIALRDAGTSDPWSVKRLLGERAPYNDKASWATDPFERKVYMLGGERPGEGDNIPSSDLFCLDTMTMKWKDLTKSLVYRKPDAPMSVEECARQVKELPQLTLPACTLLRLHGTSFLLIFGGFKVGKLGHEDDGEASSTLIMVNLRHLEWWSCEIRGGPVAGRIDSTIIAIDNKLFIFGGYRHFNRGGRPHNSYCIASVSDDGSAWEWEARDVQYTSDVPNGTIFGRATPIYNNSKILLTPWRAAEDNVDHRNIDFTDNNLFCFHIERKKFQMVDVTGDFPRNIQWYFTFPLDAPFNPSTPTTVSTSQARRRTPRKSAHDPPPPTSTTTTTTTPSSSSISTVLFCCWADRNGDPNPELWRLELTPSERISKLNIGRTVHELRHSFEGAALVGNHFYLLGSLARNDDSRSEDDNAYDIYLDVPLHRVDASS